MVFSTELDKTKDMRASRVVLISEGAVLVLGYISSIFLHFPVYKVNQLRKWLKLAGLSNLCYDEAYYIGIGIPSSTSL